MAFDIDRFVDLSKAVETSDLDWDYIKRVGITPDEARILRYMADVESHTIIYLRDILSGHTASDPEITQFLACWVYEETHHGRALDRFLAACGYPPEQNRYSKVIADMGWQEHIEAFLTVNIPKMTPHFAATHMSWGAVDEMMAASAYTQLAYYTSNEELSKLLLRMAELTAPTDPKRAAGGKAAPASARAGDLCDGAAGVLEPGRNGRGGRHDAWVYCGAAL